MAAGDYGSLRYSTLDAINTTNVQNLHVVTTLSTGIPRGHEGNPLVVNNTMYVVTPYPNNLLAIDLTKTGGALKWAYEPHPDPRSVGIACCDVVNRGAQYADGKIVYSLLDATVVAVDEKDGHEVWRTKVGNIDIGETFTAAPLVVKDKVFVGNSGGELGVRGYIVALDLNSGKELWRAYHTGPDADVKIGASFKPFYEKDRGKDLGVSSWPSEQWKLGGSTAWGWFSYDPQTQSALLWDRQSRRLESRSPCRREQMVVRDYGARRRLGRAAVGVPGCRARRLGLRRDHGEPARRHAVERAHAQAAHPPGTHGLHVRPRSRDGRGAVGQHLRANQLGDELGSEDGQAGRGFHQADEIRHRHKRDLSLVHRSKGRDSVGVLTADRAGLHSGAQHVHGLRRRRGELHRRNAVSRREREDVSGAGRVSG